MLLQQLILRANRYLAAALLENRLISSEDVEKANARLLELLQSTNPHNASVLSILIYDLQALDEKKLIHHLVEREKVGLVHLDHFQFENAPMEDIGIEECSATMTIPFDRIGNAVCVATCYYLSKPVTDYWNSKFENILWYSTSVESFGIALDKIPHKQNEKSNPSE